MGSSTDSRGLFSSNSGMVAVSVMVGGLAIAALNLPFPEILDGIKSIARPRIWYIRTLLQLKWSMRKATGSGKLSEDVVLHFAETPYEGKIFNRQAILLVRYAIKQLVGINDMWWIMYSFVPFYRDEPVLMAGGFQLRALITQFVMQPVATYMSNHNEYFGRVDARELLDDIRKYASWSGRQAKSCILPTVRMQVDKNRTIPVSFLPMDAAITFHEGPPPYGQVGHPENVALAAKDQDDDGYSGPIPIFVSHQWASPGYPDYEQDFDKMLMLLSHTIQSSIQASVMLLRNGFPLEQLVWKQGRFMRPAFRLDDIFLFDDMGEDTENLIWQHLEQRNKQPLSKTGKCETKAQPKLPQISGRLARDIFRLTARHVVKCWDGSETLPIMYEWHLAIMNQIWLWYDYSSLPQGHNRNTPELEEVFGSTLKHLTELQQRCHTLCMNGEGGDYLMRAWCMAEYINADATVFDARTEYGHVMARWQRKTDTDMLPFRAFELLINPTIPLESVLEKLGLAFTDETHMDKVPVICWILWNSILRRKLFFYDYYYSFEEAQPKLLIAAGPLEQIIAWLTMVESALRKTYDPEKEKPLREAMQSYDDVLGYNQTAWVEARIGANEKSASSKFQDIVFPYEDKEEDTDPNAVADVITEALTKLSWMEKQGKAERDGPNVYYRVFIEDQRSREGEQKPHFSSALHDSERY